MIRTNHSPARLNRRHLAVFGGLALFSGCLLGGGQGQVSPDEIPALEARLEQEPNHGPTVLRYSAALFAADQCDSASAVAQRGMTLRPADAIGPLIVGQCQEQAGQYPAALATYDRFTSANSEAQGVSAVLARSLIARRQYATENARTMLASEQQLAGQGTPSADALAVLPFTISGDSIYQPLARGLAQMVMSDLGILRQFQIVERIELRALLDEMQLGQSQRVDAQTAARVGRLVRAGRMVQGAAFIPEDGTTRLDGLVVESDAVASGADAHTGRFRDLLQLEKQLVLSLVTRLGYAMSEAERQLILENGTESLAAFLAYSRGLEAEELGDYSAAALHFSTAVQADPGFSAAQQRYQANSVAPGVQGATAGQVTQVASTNATNPTGSPVPVAAALNGVIGDIAATQGEQTTESTSSTPQSAIEPNAPIGEPLPPTIQPPETLQALIRIFFVIP